MCSSLIYIKKRLLTYLLTYLRVCDSMLLNYMTEHALGTLGLCILETFLSFLFKIMNVYLGLQLYSSSAQCTFTQATDRPTVKSDLFVEKQYRLDIKE